MKNAILASCIAVGSVIIYAGIETLHNIETGLINVSTLAGYGFIAGGIGLIIAPFIGLWLNKKDMEHISQEKLCRMCGLRKPLALDYDTDGLCRECLMELVELQKKEKVKRK